jgi:hypothetical protein
MAWADHDPAVTLASADYDEAGITCRFWVASKVVNNGNGTWTYLYNIQNLNSNRSGSSFVLPKGNFVDITNAGHSFIPAHSGDVYAGTPWNWSDAGSSLAWTCPQTFAQNPNASALRWGAMYTYWFTATTPPTTAAANIGLFMPGGTSSVAVLIPVPGAAPCAPDLNADGSVDFFDYDDFVSCFEGISCLPGLSADFNHDGSVDFFDYDDFVAAFEIGC